MAQLPAKKQEVPGPLALLRRRMDQLFEDFFTPAWGLEPVWAAGVEWSPSMDLSETNAAYIVKAELPGIDPKEIEINVTNDVLTIKGEKRREEEKKDKTVHWVERSYGSFYRSLRLAAAIDSGKVSAEFDNGLLTVTVPKKEEAEPKTVKVNVEITE